MPQIGLIDATKVYLVGPSVTQYDFDQYGTEMALAHAAVDPSKQKDRRNRPDDGTRSRGGDAPVRASVGARHERATSSDGCSTWSSWSSR